ncbi:MAG TPA: TOBE domain-containing protein, partial [Allocoleopsis sp.]
MTLADQIVVLKQGRIQQIGDPQTIYACPANRMVATFLGNPPMNVLPATFQDGAFHLADQSFACPPAIATQISLQPGQSVDLGIRPEHLQVVSDPEDSHFTVEVSVVEPLGREVLIRAILHPNSSHAAGSIINLQVNPEIRVCPGDRLGLQIDFSQLFIFNAATGERVHPVG